MSEHNEHIEELISKYLAGEANLAESKDLEGWRKLSEENELHFKQSEKLFIAIQKIDEALPVNVDAAWEKMEQRMKGNEAKVIPLQTRFTPLRIAASILLLAVLGIVIAWLFNNNEVVETRLVADNTISEQKLPDGSKVFMNKKSELTFVVTKNKREVKLKGEAFFEVVHNAEQPFEITVNDVMIKDIGTAFNVKALPESNVIEVLVESGEVQFYSAVNQGLNLIKGEKAVYDKTTKEFRKITILPDDNSISYKSKIFHFNNTSLKEIVDAVNEVYGSNIQLANEKMGACRVTVEFNNESLEELLSIIAETLDLTIERKNETIILNGAQCPD